MFVLLIANSIFTGILWFKNHRPQRPNRISEKPEMKNKFFSDFMGFDSSQRLAFDSLFIQHHKKINELKLKERNAKVTLFNLLKSDTASQSTVEYYANQASLITMQIDTLTYYHFKKIKSICKPDQMDKLADFFENHFLHQNEMNPEKRDSIQNNREENDRFKRRPPHNRDQENLIPEGTPPPPPPMEEKNEAGPPPPDRRPPGPPENK